jgi:hypothetical protein
MATWGAKRKRTSSKAPISKWKGPPRRIAGATHKFCRTGFFDGLLTSLPTVAHIANAQSTTFNQLLPGAAEYLAMFDQYKITKVEWTYSPRFDSLDAGTTFGAGGYALPRIMTCTDKDDDSTPTGQVQMGQYDNLKLQAFDKPVKITYRPHVATALYNGVSSTGYGNASGVWVDSGSPNVPHYGHKLWIDLWNANYLGNFKVDVRV